MKYTKFTSADKKAYYKRMEKIIEEYNANGKMTVLLVTDNFYPVVDGVLSVVDNYARRLSGRVNVMVCAPVHRWNVPDVPYPVLYCDSMYIHPIRYDYSRASQDRKFRGLLNKLRVDIIHIHSPYFTGRYMVDFANKNNIPVISTFHTQYRQDLKRVFKTDTLTDAVLDVLMKVFYMSDKVLTMNTATLATLRSYGFDGDAAILPNGTDMVFDTDKETLLDIAREKFSLADGETVFLFVGRLIKPKNIYLILDALKILSDSGQNFKMIYVGDGDEKSRLRAAIKAYGLEHKVSAVGKILDKTLLKALYCRADLFLFPSVYDSDGIVKYEAAAFGTPSLLLAGSNAACGITDGVNGFLCGPSPKNMAEKIKSLLADKELLKTVGDGARNTIYRQWDDIVDELYAIYCEVLAKTKANPIAKGKKNMEAALKYKYKSVRRSRKKLKFIKGARKKIQKKQQKKSGK